MRTLQCGPHTPIRSGAGLDIASAVAVCNLGKIARFNSLAFILDGLEPSRIHINLLPESTRLDPSPFGINLDLIWEVKIQEKFSREQETIKREGRDPKGVYLGELNGHPAIFKRGDSPEPIMWDGLNLRFEEVILSQSGLNVWV